MSNKRLDKEFDRLASLESGLENKLGKSSGRANGWAVVGGAFALTALVLAGLVSFADNLKDKQERIEAITKIGVGIGTLFEGVAFCIAQNRKRQQRELAETSEELATLILQRSPTLQITQNPIAPKQLTL